jgi:hypothetical protein
MPIQFACQCGKSLRAADEHAGKRAKCNACGQVVTIPGSKKPAPEKVLTAVPSAATMTKKTAPSASSKASIATPPKASTAAPSKASAAVSPRASAGATPKSAPDDFFSAELAAAKPAATRSCPSCKQVLSNAAVICIKCGFNLKAGQNVNALAHAYASPKSAEKPKPRRQSFLKRFVVSRLTSGKLMSGLAMMLGAVVWFVGGLFIGLIFYYPPVLFIIGVFTFLTGLIDGGD